MRTFPREKAVVGDSLMRVKSWHLEFGLEVRVINLQYVLFLKI